MTERFRQKFFARWGDMDFNAHMANTAYLDVAADTRMSYFEQCGFPASEFERGKIGPVILKDEVEYQRELRLHDPFEVTLVLAGLSNDRSRFRVRNEVFRADGQLAARVTSTGCWLDLESRTIVEPPADLARILENLVRAEDYEEL